MKQVCLLFVAAIAATAPVGFSQSCEGLQEHQIQCSATNCSETIEVLVCSPPNQSEDQCVGCQVYADCCCSRICDAEYEGSCGDALARSLKHVQQQLAELGVPLYVPACDGGYVQVPEAAWL